MNGAQSNRIEHIIEYTRIEHKKNRKEFNTIAQNRIESNIMEHNIIEYVASYHAQRVFGARNLVAHRSAFKLLQVFEVLALVRRSDAEERVQHDLAAARVHRGAEVALQLPAGRVSIAPRRAGEQQLPQARLVEARQVGKQRAELIADAAQVRPNAAQLRAGEQTRAAAARVAASLQRPVVTRHRELRLDLVPLHDESEFVALALVEGVAFNGDPSVQAVHALAVRVAHHRVGACVCVALPPSSAVSFLRSRDAKTRPETPQIEIIPFLGL